MRRSPSEISRSTPDMGRVLIEVVPIDEDIEAHRLPRCLTWSGRCGGNGAERATREDASPHADISFQPGLYIEIMGRRR